MALPPGHDRPMPPPSLFGVIKPEGTGQVVKRKRRPARQQVKPGQISKKPLEQAGQTYNIWYHKWAGGDKFDDAYAKEKSQSRVVIATDSGYTRADASGNKFICLFFARGCCPLGSECTYMHRLPLPESEYPDAALDVFGREKHATYRDDMGGVGSFSKQNRTLYVGRIKANTRNVEELVEEQFSEFGEIERIRCLGQRGVAFVSYVREHSAQFAKEAMMHQSLTDEVLNIRWATEDPNPRTRVDDSGSLITMGEEGIAKKLPANLVRAVREMDELEGVVGTREDEFDDDTHDDEAVARGSAKRQRLGAGPAQLSSATPAALPAPAQPVGLLSAAAMAGLQQVAAQRQQAPPKAPSGLAGLASYGSDDED